jgi:hypothetical protein
VLINYGVIGLSLDSSVLILTTQCHNPENHNQNFPHENINSHFNTAVKRNTGVLTSKSNLSHIVTQSQFTCTDIKTNVLRVYNIFFPNVLQSANKLYHTIILRAEYILAVHTLHYICII